jgi:polo-like kinase 1
MAPRFDTKTNLNLGSLREPLTEINKDMRNMGPPLTPSGSMKKISSMSSDVGANDFYLAELQKQLRSVIEGKPALKVPLMEDEAEDPKCLPMVWVSKWVDYSDKYGFGYALSDESIGVLFNDATKLLLLSDGR